MRLLLLIVTGVAVVLTGVAVGWRWIVAPLLVYAVVRWAITSLRALAKDAEELAGQGIHPAPVAAGERTFFWCEECETEVLLLVRGSSRAPSHCGQRMHERTELLTD
jgi:hypothetical protein